MPRSSRRTKLVVRADGFIGSANNLVSPACMCRDNLISVDCRAYQPERIRGSWSNGICSLYIGDIVFATQQRLPMQAWHADCVGSKICSTISDRSADASEQYKRCCWHIRALLHIPCLRCMDPAEYWWYPPSSLCQLVVSSILPSATHGRAFHWTWGHAQCILRDLAAVASCPAPTDVLVKGCWHDSSMLADCGGVHYHLPGSRALRPHAQRQQAGKPRAQAAGK